MIRYGLAGGILAHFIWDLILMAGPFFARTAATALAAPWAIYRGAFIVNLVTAAASAVGRSGSGSGSGSDSSRDNDTGGSGSSGGIAAGAKSPTPKPRTRPLQFKRGFFKDLAKDS